jgi:hypothetical protein
LLLSNIVTTNNGCDSLRALYNEDIAVVNPGPDDKNKIPTSPL